MAIAWTGFPLAKLVELAKPLASAKYRADGNLQRSARSAPGQRQTWYPWPYAEGLTMAEATNELAFIATGAYGHPIAKQHGRAAAPRGAVEVRLQVDQVDRALQLHRPAAEGLSGKRCRPSEYGFWANVNPEVPHPRWSHATGLPLARREAITANSLLGAATVPEQLAVRRMRADLKDALPGHRRFLCDADACDISLRGLSRHRPAAGEARLRLFDPAADLSAGERFRTGRAVRRARTLRTEPAARSRTRKASAATLSTCCIPRRSAPSRRSVSCC